MLVDGAQRELAIEQFLLCRRDCREQVATLEALLRASAQAEVGLARFGTIGLLFVILVLLILPVQRGEHRLLP